MSLTEVFVREVHIHGQDQGMIIAEIIELIEVLMIVQGYMLML